MQEYQTTSQVQNLRRRKERQATSPDATSQPHRHTQQLLQLQRTFGNRKVGQFLQAKRLTPQGTIPGLQRKLTVGAANDQYEQEADRVARQVLSMSDATAATSLQRAVSPEEDKEQRIQTKPVAPAITPFVQRQGQDEERDESIQTKSSGSLSDSFEAGADVETQINQSKGHGSPLPDSVRTYMEPRFGVDFSHVRVHTGSDAIQMSRDVGAQAFTHGADIYFGEGRSPSNLDLTAHELTHVVQQTGNLQNKPMARRHDASATSGGRVQTRADRQVVQRDTQDVAQLDAELQACLAAEPFDRMRAAEILNGFNREDILVRLKPLSAERIAEIHQGALENPVLGPNSQVALLTQATHAEVTQADTGAGGAGNGPSATGAHGTSGSSGPNVVLPQVVSEMSEAAKIAEAIDRCMKNELGGAFADELRKLQESAAELVALALVMIVVTALSEGAALVASAALVGKLGSDVIDLLRSFVRKATNAQDDETLNAAAHDLAAAIAMAGVNVVLAILLHKAGKSGEHYTKPPQGYRDLVTPEGEIIRVPQEAIPEENMSQMNGEGEGEFEEPPATVRSFSFTTSEVWQYTGSDGVTRLIVVMNTSRGPQAFYKRSGTGQKPQSSTTGPGNWVPFDGFAVGDYSKGHYYTEHAPSSRPVPRELSGYGNQEFKEIGMWLNGQEITPTQVIEGDYLPIQEKLEALGAKVSVKHFERTEEQ